MPMSPRLLRPRASGLVLPSDADARAYVQAVNTADGQPLEAPVVQAIDAFVIGCKADGIWSAIKASCILMGARTLAGALTPLVGSAPTNNGPFVAADYVRGGATPGLKGNGSTKFLNSNRAESADGQDDFHQSVFVSQLLSNPTTGYNQYIGVLNSRIYNYPINGFSEAFVVHGGGAFQPASTRATGLKGSSRTASNAITARTGGSTYSGTNTSVSPAATLHNVFGASGFTSDRTDGRLAFYSIGSSLNLAALDSRVSTLVAAMASVT